MQLNAEDGGNRKFIMVQLPELTDENSEAYKAGYKNICEIGKERIRRAGAKIKADNPLTTGDLDIGFRVLKLDSSNMKDVYYTPEEFLTSAQTSPNPIWLHGQHQGRPLTRRPALPSDARPRHPALRENHALDGEVFHVNGNYLIACFDKVDIDQMTEIAKQRPKYAVFRDSGFASDSDMVNFEQIIQHLQPGNGKEGAVMEKKQSQASKQQTVSSKSEKGQSLTAQLGNLQISD